MINDKLVTKNNLNKSNKELYNKLKSYVDTNLTPMNDEEFDNILTSELVVNEDTDDLVFLETPQLEA